MSFVADPRHRLRQTLRLMRFLLIALVVPLTASFASTPYKGPGGRDLILAETNRAVLEGLLLIRDTYEFENAEHPMIGWTPDSPGPHKLIVVLSGLDASDETVFANNAAFADAGPWRRPSPHRGTGWSSWRRQTTRTSAIHLAPSLNPTALTPPLP